MASLFLHSKHLSRIGKFPIRNAKTSFTSSSGDSGPLFKPIYCNEHNLGLSLYQSSKKYNYHSLSYNPLENLGLLAQNGYGSKFQTTRNYSDFYRPGLNNRMLTMPNFEGIEIPSTNQKLSYLDKVPVSTIGMPARKMTKSLHLIRGEEEIHTDFLYGQYGIVALRGGFLKHGHIEMIRNGIGRKINTKKTFAIWRIEAPWKSHTKKGIGKRMGQGKGNISYFTSPVKAKRVIIEVGGKCTFQEVKRILEIIAHKLPFPAAVMTQQMIEDQRIEEKRLEEENLNPWTFKYMFQNNMLGYQMYLKKYIDAEYFGKYE